MKASVVEKGGSFDELKVVDDRAPRVVVEPDDVVVRVKAAALNPIDWKMLMYSMFVKQWPHVFGADGAGTVEALGDAAAATGLKVGDRVWFYSGLGEEHSGTLAELVRVPVDFIGRVPEEVSLDEASTLALGALTGALMVYDACESKPVPSLVYGASSSVGLYALQLAKANGSRVVAIASKQHAQMLETLGADLVLDYHDADWSERAIAALGEGSGAQALDAISSEDTKAACIKIVAACGGKIVAGTDPSKPPAVDENGVKAMGVNLSIGYTESRPLVTEYVKKLERLLLEGKLKPNASRVVGGLDAVPQAFQDMMDGKVRGEKLVVNP